MCYSGQCEWERVYGPDCDCAKPKGMSCPHEVEYEYEEMLRYEREGDDGLE